MAATGGYDQVLGTDTLECVDLLAPSGGLGDTPIQAYPVGPYNYTRAITGWVHLADVCSAARRLSACMAFELSWIS